MRIQLMVQAFLSPAIITPEGARAGALLVERGHIRAVCTAAEVPADAERIDLGQAALLPGLVDTHVHLNEPGRTDWEGFWTGTRAAAAGGYTTLVDMPLNCLPETTTVDALQAKRSAASGKCWVDWASWGGLVPENAIHFPQLAAAGVPGFKCFLIYPGCDGLTMIDERQLEAALPAVAATGLPLLVHAELAEPIERAASALVNADWRSYNTYLLSRPDVAELQAIQLLVGLCRTYRFRLHIVHLSSALAVDQLRSAKAEGLALTVETCPHYLRFAAEDIPDGATLLKCAPPIRSQLNREALWAALQEGVIDLVATDHSPCPPGMKRAEMGRFDLAWGGVASLSVALPVMATECHRRGLGLEYLARWMSAAPAALAGFGHCAGALKSGREASFVVFDPSVEHFVDAAHLHTRHPTTPYIGDRLRGIVRATYLRGEPVWHEGQFATAPRGREIRIGSATR